MMNSLKRFYTRKRGLFKVITMSGERPLSLGGILEKQALKRGDRPLIYFEGRTITYREFNETANRYAHFFSSRGFSKGDIVALLMDNRPEFLLVHAGLAKLGVVPALINSNIRGRILAHALNISEAKAVVLGHEFLRDFIEIASDLRISEPGLVLLEKEGLDMETPRGMEDIEPLLESQPAENPVAATPVTTGDILEYIYTSGTTGMPKATKLRHHHWIQLGYGNGGYIFGMLPGEVHYCCLPLYHNSGINIAWSSTLMNGAVMALRRKFSASAFWDDVRRYNAKTFVYVGELCRYLNNLPPRPDDADNPLETIVGNGMRGDYWPEFQKRFNIKRIVEVYGSTEGVGGLLNLKGVPGMIGRLKEKGIRIGYVVRYDMEREEFVRDAGGFLQKCTPGERGMYISRISRRTPFEGYKNNRKATSDKILENAFRKGDRYFISGDIFQLHPGEYVSFIDRLGDTFKWKGEVVATNEVADILNRFGSFEDCNVYGVEVRDTEGRCGMAAVTFLEKGVPDLDALSSYVVENLPAYARPYFIRVRDGVDSTASFKKIKTALQSEGFDPGAIGDPLYFLDPGTWKYVTLDGPLYARIQSGGIRF